MDITQIITSVITLLVAIIVAIFIPLLKKKYGQETINTAVAATAQIASWIEVFVKAAEMKFSEPKSGAEKKAYVLDLIQKKLSELNLKVDTDVLEAEVEAAVCNLKQALK